MKDKYTKLTFLFLISLLSSTNAAADLSVEGYWASIDEKTEKVTGYWKLEVVSNRLLGYLVNYPELKPKDVCDKCTGEIQEFFEKPIIGTAWINLSVNKDGVWEEGYIIDSGEGEKYKARIWVEDGNLKMRGYLGVLYRTQTWLRSNQVEAENAMFDE